VSDPFGISDSFGISDQVSAEDEMPPEGATGPQPGNGDTGLSLHMPTGEEMQQWAVDAQQLYPPESQPHPSGDPDPQSPSGNISSPMHMEEDLPSLFDDPRVENPAGQPSPIQSEQMRAVVSQYGLQTSETQPQSPGGEIGTSQFWPTLEDVQQWVDDAQQHRPPKSQVSGLNSLKPDWVWQVFLFPKRMFI
jgi:hypothetical protein